MTPARGAPWLAALHELAPTDNQIDLRAVGKPRPGSRLGEDDSTRSDFAGQEMRNATTGAVRPPERCAYLGERLALETRNDAVVAAVQPVEPPSVPVSICEE